MIKLYDYQQEAVAAVRARWYGQRNLLGIAATGSGKTVIFLSALLGVGATPPLLKVGQRAIILAHRTELVEQPVSRISQFWPEWSDSVGVVQSNKDEVAQQIICASVRTLANENRLSHVLEHGAIDYLIVDEAHHANAPIYQYIIERLCSINPEMRHLGVTATPERHDADGLSAVYEDVAFTFGIKELVERGFLASPRWLGVETAISLDGVQSVNKAGGVRDFQTAPLSARFETPAMHDLVVRIHCEYAAGRKAIVFTATVDGAKALAAAFQAAGISTAWVSGKHPQRASLVQSFRDGTYQVVVNAQVLVEGFDQPDVDCIHMVRPTRSDAFYLQCIGRALRTWPEKHDALIVDYMPLDERNVVLLGDVLGLPRTRQIQQRGERGAVVGTFTLDDTFRDAAGVPIEFSLRELDYLGHANAIRWSEVMIAQLGTAPDRDLAARWHISEASVARKRNDLGIAPYRNDHFLWTPNHEAQLGTAPDRDLAARWDISKQAVRQRRQKHGIASYEEQLQQAIWTPDAVALLGTDHDRTIADLLKVSVASVKAERKRRGIEAYGKKPVIEWTPDKDSQLGTVSDRELAELWNVSVTTVRNRRVLLEIEAYSDT
jgi:superfamily II DNA or RNA helicase